MPEEDTDAEEGDEVQPLALLSRFRTLAAYIGYKRESIGILFPWQIRDEYVDWLNFSRKPEQDGEESDMDDEEVTV